jgi:hypothetical protein
VGGAELLFPFGGAEDVPALDGYPEDAGDVGSGEDAVDLDEFGVAFGAGGEGDDAGAALVLFEAHPGEHFAADRFVAYPEDEAAELHGFEYVRKGEEIGASAFDVDLAPSFPATLPPPPMGYFGRKLFVLMRLRQ